VKKFKFWYCSTFHCYLANNVQSPRHTASILKKKVILDSNEEPYFLSEHYNALVLSGCVLLVELVLMAGSWNEDQVITHQYLRLDLCSADLSDNSQDCSLQPNSRRCQKCSSAAPGTRPHRQGIVQGAAEDSSRTLVPTWS